MRSPKLIQFAMIVVALSGATGFVALIWIAGNLYNSARLDNARAYAEALGVALLFFVALALVVGFTMSVCEVLSDLKELTGNVPEARPENFIEGTRRCQLTAKGEIPLLVQPDLECYDHPSRRIA